MSPDKTSPDKTSPGKTSPEIVPVPSDDEAVAIAVAMTGFWQAAPVVSAQVKARETGWKFSGRWWSRPVQSRRDRPHR